MQLSSNSKIKMPKKFPATNGMLKNYLRIKHSEKIQNTQNTLNKQVRFGGQNLETPIALV